MITLELLQQLFPRTKVDVLERYVDPLINICEKYEINTPERVAMFLAQIGHESAGLSVVEENLNYRADRLAVVFPKYFRDVNPNDYARNPEKIANRVYANRMGNGPESSGDGWRYRGRSIIQCTGKSNYRSCSEYLYGDENILLEDPDILLNPEDSVACAAWFWTTNNLNQWADNQDILTVTKKINGGTHGLEDRTRLFNLGMSLLG
jgi:putative chitinase